MGWTITYSARSHVGLRRENNEDNLFANGVLLPPGSGNRPFSLDGVAGVPAVFAVCDGMGGEEAGERASLLSVTALQNSAEELCGASPKDLEEAVQQYTRRAHKAIQSEAQGTRSGTTLALAVLTASGIRCFNLGDSRIYCLRQGRFWQVTNDHTVETDLLRMGVSPRNDGQADHRLTRCIGIGDLKPVEAYPSISGSCRLVICSDGLSGMVDVGCMEEILKSTGCSAAADLLLQAALQNGGHDNVTAIVLNVEHQGMFRFNWHH